jgi:putative glycosyltransferase
MMTGLAHARDERIFLIDSGLEEEPERLCGFAAQMDRDGCQVVYGVQKSRKGGWFQGRSGDVPRMTGVDMPRQMVTARLLRNHGSVSFTILVRKILPTMP